MSILNIIGSIAIILFIVLVLKLLNEWLEYDNYKNNTSNISNNLVCSIHLWHDKRKKRGRNQGWLAAQIMDDRYTVAVYKEKIIDEIKNRAEKKE